LHLFASDRRKQRGFSSIYFRKVRNTALEGGIPRPQDSGPGQDLPAHGGI